MLTFNSRAQAAKSKAILRTRGYAGRALASHAVVFSGARVTLPPPRLWGWSVTRAPLKTTAWEARRACAST